ncbi:MAG TPA: hypothetical protein DDZ89_06570 [Clostridiales bacterium]|nr:hypothetical protein [Clostridiales bacterium]
MKYRSLPMIIFTILVFLIGSIIIFSFIYAPEVVVTADDAFKTLNVKSGTFFTIELEATPSTGYTWSFKITNDEVVQYIKDEYIPAKDTETLGASGLHRFVFRAMSDGETSIKMQYEKSFADSKEPAQFRDFNIKVK